MQSLTNIDKSSARKGVYIGYGGGDVYRISRQGTYWIAARNILGGPKTPVYLSGATLREISEKLTAL